jgi:hypothetical protein
LTKNLLLVIQIFKARSPAGARSPDSQKRYIKRYPNATKAVSSKRGTFVAFFLTRKEIDLLLKQFTRERLMPLPVTFISTIN